jgi:hypothetical protein
MNGVIFYGTNFIRNNPPTHVCDLREWRKEQTRIPIVIPKEIVDKIRAYFAEKPEPPILTLIEFASNGETIVFNKETGVLGTPVLPTKGSENEGSTQQDTPSSTISGKRVCPFFVLWFSGPFSGVPRITNSARTVTQVT